MAPGLASTEENNAFVAKAQSPPVFPHGIKTSGQHPPIYHELRPYQTFPNSINAPTLWEAEDYKDHPERWVHQFSPEELNELSTAADNFKAAGSPLTEVTKVGRANAINRRFC